MSRRVRRLVPIALLVGILLPVLSIGCPSLIVLKMCVQNDTDYDMVGFHMTRSTATGWGSSLLAAAVPAGGSWQLKNISPGTYDILAVFDVKCDKKPKDCEPCCVEMYGLEFDTLNLCLAFLQQGAGCDIYVQKTWAL